MENTLDKNEPRFPTLLQNSVQTAVLIGGITATFAVAAIAVCGAPISIAIAIGLAKTVALASAAGFGIGFAQWFPLRAVRGARAHLNLKRKSSELNR